MRPYALAMMALGVLGLAVLLPLDGAAPRAILAVLAASPLGVVVVGRLLRSPWIEGLGGAVFLVFAAVLLPRAWASPDVEAWIGTIAALPGLVAAGSTVWFARRSDPPEASIARLFFASMGAGLALAAAASLLAGVAVWPYLTLAVLLGAGAMLLSVGAGVDPLVAAAGLLPIALGGIAVPWLLPDAPAAVRLVTALGGCLLVPWAALTAGRRLIGALPPYRYVLVREGLLEQTLVADAVYPWHRILAFDLGEVDGRPVVVLHLLYGPEPDPPFELVGTKQPPGLAAWTRRRVRGYQSTRAWAGTDLLVGPRGLDEPAASLYARMKEIAATPGLASALPRAADVLSEGEEPAP